MAKQNKLDANARKFIESELRANGLFEDSAIEKTSTQEQLSMLTALMCELDSRVQGRTIYPARTIIIVALAGILGACQSWNDCEMFGQTHLKVLRRLDKTIKEIPSHDTLRRFFCIIAPAQLENVYRQWAKTISVSISCEKQDGDVDKRHGIKRHFALDGKTNRGAADPQKMLEENEGKLTEEEALYAKIHTETIYDVERHLPLAQECVSIKKNELEVIPKLLNCVDLCKGDVVTIDAMGTHVPLARQINDTGAYYLFEVKDNQRLLKAAIIKCMEKIMDKPVTCLECSKHTEYCHNDHSQQVTRTCYTCNVKEYMAEQMAKWPGMTTFGVINVKKTAKSGEEVIENHYFITSLPNDPALIMRHKRWHWQIENGLHWHLDVTFGEDDDRKMMNSAQNFSLLNKIALTILQNDKKKLPINRKRMLAAWDEDYLLTLLKAVIKGF